jgi:hypothetical protein
VSELSILEYLCTAKGLSVLGLFLDIVGIALLFRFQVDTNQHLSPEGSISLILEQSDEGEVKKWHLYRKLTWLGFTLLIVGFSFQLIGTIIA